MHYECVEKGSMVVEQNVKWIADSIKELVLHKTRIEVCSLVTQSNFHLGRI